MLAWLAIAMSGASLLLVTLTVLKASRENTDAEQAAWLSDGDLNREIRDAAEAATSDWIHAQTGSYRVFGRTLVGSLVSQPWAPGMTIELPVPTDAPDGRILGTAAVFGEHEGRPTIWPVVLKSVGGHATPHSKVPIPPLEGARIRGEVSYSTGIQEAP